MTAVAPSLAQGQLADALTQARMSRHHPDCDCWAYRSVKRAGYCTVDEWRWSETIDRILTTIQRQSF